ncbi:hypothetical protein Mapa_011260 [Marchantia paleacea]|nr:hypothetical protein Mapa_011260 [Marchantia paleacea]
MYAAWTDHLYNRSSSNINCLEGRLNQRPILHLLQQPPAGLALSHSTGVSAVARPLQFLETAKMPTLLQEVEMDVAAPVVWKSLKDQNTIFPKIAPHVFTSIEDVEGPDGVPGSIRKVSFGSIAPGAFVKEKIVDFDMEKFSVTSEEVEGGHLLQGFSKWVQTMSVVAVGDDKCKVVLNVEYEYSNQEILEKTKEGMTTLFKAFEGYLRTSA